MSRPTSERAAVLLGHGAGALPPAAGARGTARHAWLDSTMSVTLLAPAGAAFDDEAAVAAWARRAWADLAGPGDDAVPSPVAWRAGRRRRAVVGVTWPSAELAATAPGLRSMAPLWAGVLAHAAKVLPGDGAQRLVVAEGPALTLIDLEDGVPQRWSTLALARADAAALGQAAAGAAGPVWVAGHSLAGEPPVGVQPLPGLGLPSQAPPALLQALRPQERAEPALRRAPPLAPRLGLALLATAAAVAALAALAAWDARQAWAAAAARAEARERIGAALAAAQQRLHQPWALRWAAAESAQPEGGGWLRLEQRRDSATLLLVGEAESPAAALAVVRRIAVAPGVAEATLLRSESPGAAARARFELGVRVAEAGIEGPR